MAVKKKSRALAGNEVKIQPPPPRKRRKQIYMHEVLVPDRVYRPLLEQAHSDLRYVRHELRGAGMNTSDREQEARVAALETLVSLVDLGLSDLLSAKPDIEVAANLDRFARSISGFLREVETSREWHRPPPRSRSEWAVEAREELQQLIGEEASFRPTETYPSFARKCAMRIAGVLDRGVTLVAELRGLSLGSPALRTLEHEITTRLRNEKRDPEPMIRRALVLAGMPERHARSLFEFESVRAKRKPGGADK